MPGLLRRARTPVRVASPLVVYAPMLPPQASPVWCHSSELCDRGFGRDIGLLMAASARRFRRATSISID